MRRLQLVGRVFGRLTVIAAAGTTGKYSLWLCRCDCGVEKIIYAPALVHGSTVSCGCYAKERSTKHGLSNTVYADKWHEMVKRCYCVTANAYPDYGGRGIRICEFLRASPANLLYLLGELPSAGHTIDRINNNGHYSCGQCPECLRCGLLINVRWATPIQQARNKRNNRMVTVEGATKCIGQWAEELGITYGCCYKRWQRGVDLRGKQTDEPIERRDLFHLQ